jgi:hypothetical protein
LSAGTIFPLQAGKSCHGRPVTHGGAESRTEVEMYLRNREQQWVARRTPRHLQAPPTSGRRAFVDAMIENLHPENLLGP